MKKILFVSFCCLLCVGVSNTANAQIGGNLLGKAVGKAAQKLANKTVDKAVDALEKEAEKRMGIDDQAKPGEKNNNQVRDNQSNPEENTYRQGRVEETQGGTYASVREVMAAMPALPTAKELTTYKEAEMNGGGLRLITSPVTRFTMEVAALSMQAMQFAYNDIDTAKLQEQAYQAIEKSTGLTKADIERMEKMSDEEQEAYMRAHVASGKMEQAGLQQAENMAKYMEPVQPQIDQWDAVNKKVDGIYEKLAEQQKSAYAKYAKQLEGASDKARNAILIKYYGEFVEASRSAVQQAMRLRMNEQLPIAEELEKYFKGIRESNPDYVNLLMNYPQQTQMAYFSEVSHLLEIPEF